jgi:Fe-Mn family superoxide dismutase
MSKKENFLKGIVKEAVKEVSSKIELPSLSEAYVVQARKHSQHTDSLSQKTISIHNELLDGYVKSLNEVSIKLDSADRDSSNPNSSEFRQLKLDEAHLINAAFLHGLFFENIGDPESSIATEDLAHIRLSRDWGGFDSWQRDFIACSMAARNGWAVTCYNTFLDRYINVVVDLHSLNVPFGCIPVIVMDCWEHSYFTDYGKDRKTYVYAMMKELKWEKINKRFEDSEKISRVLK